jgi:hypothetical protein
MIRVIIIISTILCYHTAVHADDVDCNSNISKLKAECNFIGKGFKKMKSFSQKNKTIDQSTDNLKKSLGNVKEKIFKK